MNTFRMHCICYYYFCVRPVSGNHIQSLEINEENILFWRTDKELNIKAQKVPICSDLVCGF